MMSEAFDRKQGFLHRVCLFALPLLCVLTWIGESKSNNYAISEFFLTYKHGFLKRALLGDLLGHLKFISVRQIAEIEVVLVFLALAVSYLVFWRMLSSGAERAVLALLFLCSPASLAHLSDLAAQPDVQLYTLLLLAYLCLVRLPASWSPLVALVPCVAAAMVHEAFTLLFYPLILIVLWDGYRQRKFHLPVLAVHLVGYGIVFLAILHFGKIHVDPSVMLREAQARTSTNLNTEVFDVLSYSLKQQWATLMKFYSEQFVAAVVVSIAFLTPYLAGVAILTAKVNGLRARPIPAVGLVALVLIPMSLMFLGHDVLRWLAGAVIDLLLFLVYLYETREPEVMGELGLMGSPAVYAVLLYGLAIGPMGGATVRALARLVDLLKAS